MNFADIFVIIFSVLLILVVFIQQSKDDAREAFSGGSADQKGKSLAAFDRFLTIVGGSLIVLILIFVIISRFVLINQM